jgi:DNA repair exonuclease SbcCD ATPase subunit
MKAFMMMLALATFSSAGADSVSPIEKVIEMLADLEAKIIGEGKEAQKIYDEYAQFCDDKSMELGFEIKTGKSEVAELTAGIEKETSTIAELETKIEELSEDIKTDDSDLDKATKVREKEHVDFAAEEKELTEVLSMLERATSILSKEMKKEDSFVQLKNANNIVEALNVMVQAAAFSSADASRLTALVQTQQQSSDDDEEPGAPDAAEYENHSGGIIGTLEGLTEKAEAQLEKARKAESTSKHNFEMLKQSLTDSIEFAEKDMDKAKKALAESQEKKATAEGDLDVTSKDLAEDLKAKATLHQECMTAAEEFELSTKSRGEELKALAVAKKVIKESTGGAAEQTYGLTQSFLQVQMRSTGVDAVHFVRNLARKMQSSALAQLASRMSSAMKLSAANGDDPFAKVEGLIKDMIATLESEAEADAAHKAYCDKETAESTAKKDDLTAESDQLTTKINQKKAASTKLKEEVATLQNELAAMAKARAEADKLRVEEKEVYDKNSAEMKQGIEGVKLALKVLKEYYATDADHDKAEGAASGIIGLLEVCESDFVKGLTEMTAQEESAVASYEAYVKEDDIQKAKKDQAVKYKTQEAAGLDKQVAEMSTDLEAVTDELSAVLKALDKLNEMCVAKAEPYEERKGRRESEIKGLKEALSILDDAPALIQKSSKRSLRVARAH